MSQPPKKRRSTTFLGMAVFFLLLIWALWHGVIGPRVIDPLPGDPDVVAPAPDPDREPPRE
ncbi:MAG: hypothetical protein AAGA69_11905 [Pseudomonadota bacterium]